MKNRNGRSPLVNPRHQITSFFCRNQQSPSPSPIQRKRIPNRNRSTSPVAPSPLRGNAKRDKPVLVIGSGTTAPEKDLVQKRKFRRLRRISVVEDEDEEEHSVGKIRVSEFLEDEDLGLDMEMEKIEAGERKKLRRLSRTSLAEDEIEV